LVLLSLLLDLLLLLLLLLLELELELELQLLALCLPRTFVRRHLPLQLAVHAQLAVQTRLERAHCTLQRCHVRGISLRVLLLLLPGTGGAGRHRLLGGQQLQRRVAAFRKSLHIGAQGGVCLLDQCQGVRRRRCRCRAWGLVRSGLLEGRLLLPCRRRSFRRR
jgi:hypothetical protein